MVVKSDCYEEIPIFTPHIVEDAVIEYCQAAVAVGDALGDDRLKKAFGRFKFVTISADSTCSWALALGREFLLEDA